MLAASLSRTPRDAVRAGFIVGAFGVLLAVVFMPLADAIGLAALGLAWWVVVVFSRGRLPRGVAILVAGAFVLRAGAALLNNFVVALPDSGVDAVFFENLGWENAQRGIGEVVGTAFAADRSGNLYSTLIGLVYWVIRVRSPLVIQAINVLAGTLALINIYGLVSLLWGRRAGRSIVAIGAVFPALILYSAITLREAPVVLLLTVLALRTVYAVLAGSRRDAVLAGLAGLAAALFHPGAIAGVFGVVVAVGVVASVRPGDAWNAPGRRSRRLAVVAVVSLVALGAVFVAKSGLGLFGRLTISASEVGSAQSAASGGAAAYLSGWEVNTVFDLVWQSPIRLLFFFLTPFPWQVRSGFQALGLVDVVAYWAIFVVLARNARQLWQNRPARALLIVFAALAVVFAVGTVNFGTAIRHRQKFVLLAMALAGVHWADRRIAADSPAVSLQDAA